MRFWQILYFWTWKQPRKKRGYPHLSTIANAIQYQTTEPNTQQNPFKEALNPYLMTFEAFGKKVG